MVGFIFLLSIMLGFVIHINEATLVFTQKSIVYETTRFVNGFNRKMSIVFFAARLNSFFVTLQ
ncbi:lysine transporter LysE [Bacillus thuringiensis]|nr:lysine transporter LysE [Bacillus thuringiensis]